MNKITLQVDDNCLLLNGEIMVYHYPAGDYDVIHWSTLERYHLFSYLYDAVNIGDLDDKTEVYLPDGELFGHSDGCHFISEIEYEEPETEFVSCFGY